MEQTAPVLTSQKRKYCFWTYLSACLGGYKFTIEESGQDVSLLAHILQFALFLFFPLVPLILAAVTNDYKLVLIIPGVVVSVLIIVMNLISIHQSNQKQNKVTSNNPLSLYQVDDTVILEDEDIYSLLVKPKPMAEIITVAFLTPLYTVLAASAYFYLFKRKYLGLVIVEFLTSCTIYQSLINSSSGIIIISSLVEPGVLSSANQKLGTFSSLLSRPKFACFFLKLILVGDLDEETGVMSLAMNIVYAINPVLFIVGLFGSFGAFIEYVMEQWNTILCGSSACSSQQRTLITFVVNVLIAIAIGLGLRSENNAAQYIPVLVLGVLGLRSQFNFLGEYSFEKLGQLVNHFQYLSSQTLYQSSIKNKNHTTVNLSTTILEAIAIILTSVLVRDNIPSNAQILTLFIICFAIFSIIWVLTQLQKRMLMGFIRFAWVQSDNLATATMILRKSHEVIQQVFITMVCLTQILNDKSTFRLAFITAVLIQRVFQLSHTQPCMLILTQMIAFIMSINTDNFNTNFGYNFLIIGLLVQVCYRSFKNMVRRIQIWPYAFYKMLTVKKQRVKQAWVLCLIQTLILLPFSILALIVSSIFDVPYLPYLGLPVFTVGSFRPIRNWGVLQNSMKQTSESSVYNSWLSESTIKIQEVLSAGHINLICGQYFLVRLCTLLLNNNKAKYFVTIQILESSSCYLVFAVRGLESQETTSCHGMEAREVDRMVQQYFNVPTEDGNPVEQSVINADCCGTLTPYGKLQVTSYGENQIKLTGIIEDEDFISGFKKIFLRALCTYAYQTIEESDRKMITHMGVDMFGEIYNDKKEQARVLSLFPEKYSELIGMKEKYDLQANTNDEESQKVETPQKSNPNQPQPKSAFDEIGMLMDDLDNLGISINQGQNGNYTAKNSKPPPKKSTIQNDGDDILGMLDDLENEIPIQKFIPKALTKQVINAFPLSNEKRGNQESLYLHLKKIVMLCYVLAFNDPGIVFESRVNNLLLYNLFKDSLSFKSSRQFKQSDGFKKIYQIVLLSIRAALKISIDIFSIEGTLTQLDESEIKQSFENLPSECYVGSGNDPEWNMSLKKQIPTLWSLGFQNSQNALIVYRFTQDPLSCYIFEMNDDIVKGIQANLQFELYFITNDDDERYSIQTHQQFLRNIIIESAEEPLGYCPFYSGPVITST